MDNNSIKDSISKKITYYRTQHGLTQLELAEKLSYSDKSVSKWERGDGVPDVYVLCEMAELFGVSLDDFIQEIPEEAEPRINNSGDKTWRRLYKKIFICAFSIVSVWALAAVAFFIVNSFFYSKNFPAWLAFIYAIPLSGAVLLFLSHRWNIKLLKVAALSCMNWTISVSIHLTLEFSGLPVANLFVLYTISAAVQFLVVFWFLLLKQKVKPQTWDFLKKVNVLFQNLDYNAE